MKVISKILIGGLVTFAFYGMLLLANILVDIAEQNRYVVAWAMVVAIAIAFSYSIGNIIIGKDES